MSELSSLTPDEYDRRFDRLQDLQGLSPYDARKILGQPPYPIETFQIPNQTLEVPRPNPTAPEYYGGYGPQYGEEAGVGYEDGVPPEWQLHEPMSDEQVRMNKEGAARARLAVEEARQAQIDQARKEVERAHPDTRNFEQW